MPDRLADLHLHTTASDGQLAPPVLVREAAARGLGAIAVTDHDTVAGIAAAQAAGRAHGVEVIPGIELSVTVGRTEVHLLGYFFDPEHPALRAHCAAFETARRARAARMVETLRSLGVDVTLPAVEAAAQGDVIARPHVAQALVEAGAVASMAEAFDRYVGDGRPAAVPKPLYPAEEALALLHDAGGIGVLAHPGHWLSDRVVMALVQAGLDGIETVHPSHDATVRGYYRQIVRDFGLVETGGSDFHGFAAEGEEERLGRYTVPYAVVERARAARPSARAA